MNLIKVISCYVRLKCVRDFRYIYLGKWFSKTVTRSANPLVLGQFIFSTIVNYYNFSEN